MLEVCAYQHWHTSKTVIRGCFHSIFPAIVYVIINSFRHACVFCRSRVIAEGVTLDVVLDRDMKKGEILTVKIQGVSLACSVVGTKTPPHTISTPADPKLTPTTTSPPPTDSQQLPSSSSMELSHGDIPKDLDPSSAQDEGEKQEGENGDHSHVPIVQEEGEQSQPGHTHTVSVENIPRNNEPGNGEQPQTGHTPANEEVESSHTQTESAHRKGDGNDGGMTDDELQREEENSDPGMDEKIDKLKSMLDQEKRRIQLLKVKSEKLERKKAEIERRERKERKREKQQAEIERRERKERKREKQQQYECQLKFLQEERQRWEKHVSRQPQEDK